MITYTNPTASPIGIRIDDINDSDQPITHN